MFRPMYRHLPMYRTLRAARFLVTAPFIFVLLVVVNVMTSPHHWWVQWAALGLGIAWVICLLRVLRAAVLVGGLAALVTLLVGRRNGDRS